MNREESKQDIIREGLINLIHPSGRVYLGEEWVSVILPYLHSRGCVIKVDRELPDNDVMRAQLESGQFMGQTNWYYKAQLDMKRAGYVAVEPLIKEGV